MALAFGVDIAMKIIVRELAADHLHASQIKHPITRGGGQACGFCVEEDLAHLAILASKFKDKILERRRREDDAKDAEKKQPNFEFLFCDLCEAFASSAFKNWN